MSSRPPSLSLPCLAILLIVSCCHGNTGETTTNNEGCVRIDAVLNDQKHIFLFHGNEYLKLSEDGTELRKGPIHEFGGLKGSIDAAVVWHDSNHKTKTYFFKGDKYFKLSWLVVGPYKMSAWGDDFEDGIDAAGSWESRTYFFKGCSVFLFQAGERQVEQTFDSGSVGFPCDVDGAFAKGDSFYVIKGDRAWEWGGDVDQPKPLSDVVTLSSWSVCSDER